MLRYEGREKVDKKLQLRIIEVWNGPDAKMGLVHAIKSIFTGSDL